MSPETTTAAAPVTPVTEPSAVPSESGPRQSYLLPDGTPDASVLQDRTPAWLRMSRPATVLVAVMGLVFAICNYLPLHHSDLWGHLSYGRWISQHGLPTVEPLMPLQKGMQFLDLAWGSQLLGFWTYQQFGTTGIHLLAALSVAFVMGLLGVAVYRRTGSLPAALLTFVAFLLLDSQQLTYQMLLIPRPQLAGMACFALTFVLATSSSPRPWHLGLFVATFAAWGNLHGSFPVGLLMLGTLTVGRYLDFSWRARHAGAGWRDGRFRHLLVATELAAAAVLLNPYGLGVYGEVFSVAGNANVRDLVEWEPLTLRMIQGQFAAIAAFVLACLYRLTPRRVMTSELLLLLGFGALALWTSRMIVWWGPLAAYYIGLHFAAASRRWFGVTAEEVPRTGLNTVVAVGICWICFAITPFGSVVMHGRKSPEEEARRFRKSVSPLTPIALTEWLHQNPPPAGQVFNCADWGDYLLWAGPESMPLFVYSHVHLTPEEVWEDYRLISSGAAGDWKARLDRYGVNVVIMDQLQHADMIHALAKEAEWDQVYEDPQLGSVFYRRNPI